MKKLQRLVTALVLVSMVACLAAGCNTVEGMGEDIERGGEEIQEVAN